MKTRTDCFGHVEHYFISDNDFMLNYTPYEHDEISGRYYYLEPSISMTSQAGREGGLVRRRISKADYETALAECQTRLATSTEIQERPREELQKNTAADKLRYTADRIENKVPVFGSFVPTISADDMLDDFDKELLEQFKRDHYPLNLEMATQQNYGFALALKELGILDYDKFVVRQDHLTRVDSNYNSNDSPKREAFVNLPPEKRDSGTNHAVYALGLYLTQRCPENDCRLYLNEFNMCRELDEQAQLLSGWPRQVIEMEIRKLYHEIETMFYSNYAIRQYRRARHYE